MKNRKFVDSVTLYVRAGGGGNGCMSFRREKYIPRGGPDGGDGGRGGHVILQADRDTDSLVALYFAPHQVAPRGGHGKGKKLHGRNGADLILKVPCGTLARERETGRVLGDLVEHGETLRVARGGKGGLGNPHWTTSTHQAPREHTDGEPGEEAMLELNLKLVADAGLVGLPNAGKSSLLGTISGAHPKVGAYPFTTLNPVIGTVVFDDYSTLRVADIPGLIRGAHEGTGLGDAFLKHIERSSFLVYVLDMAGVDGREPLEDYRTLRRELELYHPELAAEPCLVVANKMDLPEAAGHLETFTKETGEEPIPVSAQSGHGIDRLREALYARSR